ncbi:hypothetical protein QTN25_001324 [Entamoeba marina]
MNRLFGQSKKKKLFLKSPTIQPMKNSTKNQEDSSIFEDIFDKKTIDSGEVSLKKKGMSPESNEYPKISKELLLKGKIAFPNSQESDKNSIPKENSIESQNKQQLKQQFYSVLNKINSKKIIVVPNETNQNEHNVTNNNEVVQKELNENESNTKSKPKNTFKPVMIKKIEDKQDVNGDSKEKVKNEKQNDDLAATKEKEESHPLQKEDVENTNDNDNKTNTTENKKENDELLSHKPKEQTEVLSHKQPSAEKDNHSTSEKFPRKVNFAKPQFKRVNFLKPRTMPIKPLNERINNTHKQKVVPQQKNEINNFQSNIESEKNANTTTQKQQHDSIGKSELIQKNDQNQNVPSKNNSLKIKHYHTSHTQNSSTINEKVKDETELTKSKNMMEMKEEHNNNPNNEDTRKRLNETNKNDMYEPKRSSVQDKKINNHMKKDKIKNIYDENIQLQLIDGINKKYEYFRRIYTVFQTINMAQCNKQMLSNAVIVLPEMKDIDPNKYNIEMRITQSNLKMNQLLRKIESIKPIIQTQHQEMMKYVTNTRKQKEDRNKQILSKKEKINNFIHTNSSINPKDNN